MSTKLFYQALTKYEDTAKPLQIYNRSNDYILV